MACRRQGAGKNGDIVNLDITVIKDGCTAIPARMFVVGETTHPGPAPDPDHYEAMWIGINQSSGARLGRHRFMQSSAFAEKSGYSVVTRILRTASAGCSTKDPQVLHYGKPALSAAGSRMTSPSSR